MTEDPYGPPQVAEAQDLIGRPRYRFRLYHALAVGWSLMLLRSSLYLSQVRHLPEQYRVYWPVAVELLGGVFTIIAVIPLFGIRVIYLLVRQRFGEAVIDAASAGAAFIALYVALINHPVTD